MGRPRHHDDSSEREAILAAASVQLSEAGADMTIQAILDGAGLSTRSFYRHFASKDALLLAMYERDARYAALRLRARVEAASGPVSAVEAWIDEIFGVRRSRARAARLHALRTVHGSGADGAETAAAAARELLCAPLAEAIAGGVLAGDFAPDTNPELAANHIAVLVLDAAGVTSAHSPDTETQDSATRFCLRALGGAVVAHGADRA